MQKRLTFISDVIVPLEIGVVEGELLLVAVFTENHLLQRRTCQHRQNTHMQISSSSNGIVC